MSIGLDFGAVAIQYLVVLRYFRHKKERPSFDDRSAHLDATYSADPVATGPPPGVGTNILPTPETKPKVGSHSDHRFGSCGDIFHRKPPLRMGRMGLPPRGAPAAPQGAKDARCTEVGTGVRGRITASMKVSDSEAVA